MNVDKLLKDSKSSFHIPKKKNNYLLYIHTNIYICIHIYNYIYCTTSISIVIYIGNCSDANISNVYVLIDNKIVFEKHSQPNKEKLFSYDPRGGCLLFLFQALVELFCEKVRHVFLASQITHLMQGTKVQTIDLAIPIAILTILIHIVLDRVGGTMRIIHAVRKGCGLFG